MTLTENQMREAQLELRRRECRDHGHNMEFLPRRLTEEVSSAVMCTRCGWQGTVTMGPKP